MRPALDVRLPGLEDRSPLRSILSRNTPSPIGSGPRGSLPKTAGNGEGAPIRLDSPAAIASLPADHLLIEGGAQTAAAFLAADLVDRLLLYRAPILIGGGKAALGDIGLTDLGTAHGRWRLHDARQLGSDRVEVYEAG